MRVSPLKREVAAILTHIHNKKQIVAIRVEDTAWYSRYILAWVKDGKMKRIIMPAIEEEKVWACRKVIKTGLRVIGESPGARDDMLIENMAVLIAAVLFYPYAEARSFANNIEIWG